MRKVGTHRCFRLSQLISRLPQLGLKFGDLGEGEDGLRCGREATQTFLPCRENDCYAVVS